MKTTILLMFSLLLNTGSLMGQGGKVKYPDSIIKRDFTLSDKLYNNFQIDTSFKVINNLDLLTENKLSIFNLNQNNLFKDSFTERQFHDFVAVEDYPEYPGASRFYQNKIIINPETYGKYFIKKPDTSNKYYLIIRDPLRHTITK